MGRNIYFIYSIATTYYYIYLSRYICVLFVNNRVGLSLVLVLCCVGVEKFVYIKKRKELVTNNLVSPAAACVTGQTEANAVVIDAASRPQFPFKKSVNFWRPPPPRGPQSSRMQPLLRAPLRLLT